MTFGQRFLLMLFIVLVTLFAFAGVGFFCGRWEEGTIPFSLASESSRPELCMDGETREIVRKLMLDALDSALKSKIQDLYSVWLRDSTGQPDRASRGAENALRAYFHARGGAMKFNPPDCSG